MTKRYKNLFLLATLVILIVGISSISAADSSADTNDISASTSDVATTTSVDTSNSVSDSSNSAIDSSSSTQATSSSSSSISSSSSSTHTADSSVKSDIKTTSNSAKTDDSSSSVANTDSSSTNSNVDTSNVKTLKTEQNSNINTTAINETPSNRTPILNEVVNDNTFDSYFDDEGRINVAEGTTLTFTSDVTRNQSYIINVSVNIIGNGNTLSLNSNSISFLEGAANSNITGLNFYNTQVFVNTTENITFDNIDFKVTANGLGRNVGAFAIRDGSGNITVQNSNFYSENNGGYSLLALTLVENCTINNNNFTGVGNVGNLVYLNFYNGDLSNTKGVTANKNNTISNNNITGPSTAASVCYALTISGNANNIINNTIDYTGYAITTSWVGNITDETEDPGDEHTLESYQNKYINNTVLNNGRVTGAVNTTFIGNNFSGSVTVSDDSIVTNNTLTNVTVNGAYNEITYNTVNKINLTSTSSYNTVKNNEYVENIYDSGFENDIYDNTKISSGSSKNLKSDDDEQSVIYVTEENKDTYFNNDGSNYYTLDSSSFQENTTYYLDFDLDNSELFIAPTSNTMVGVVFSGVEGRTYTNLTIDINSARNNTIANFNIVDGQMILRSPRSGCWVIAENNTLTGTLDNNIERLDNAAVYLGYNNLGNNATNPIIFRNNVINYTARAYDIDWDVTTVPYDIVMYVDTHICSEVYGNTIIVTEFASDDGNAPTLYGVYYSSGGSGNVSYFDNNTLVLNGQEYMYGLVIGRSVNGLTISGNNITVTSINYTNGIKLENNCKNILISNNIINCTSGLDYADVGNQYVVYDIYVENMNYNGGSYTYHGNNINETIIGNTIIGTGNQVYGIEGFGYDESNIIGNTFIVTGAQPQGIAIIGTNLNITENTITVEGTSSDKGITVDYLPAITTGIQLPRAVESESNISQNTITVTNGRGILIDDGADYVNIDDNRIIVSDYNYAVELNTTGTNSNVTNNYLKTDRTAGDNAVYELTEGNHIENNQPNGIETFIKLDPITDAKVSDVITITGTVTNEEELPFTDSKVMITVNDEEPITVDVAEDGIFKAEYTVKKVGENTATAEYVADDTYSYSQDSITFEVPRIVTNIEISDISAYPETEYTIKGTLTNEAALQLEDQKLTIIVNSETIEVDVAEDGTFTTTLKASSKPGDYDIVLFYGGNDDYESTYTTATLTVEKYNTLITANYVTGKYSDTVQLTAVITDTAFNNVTDGKVVFKLNGVTIKDEDGNPIYAYVDNGVASLDYTLINNIGTYNISATYSGSDDFTEARTEDIARLTIVNATADITITDQPSISRSGETVTFTAVVSDEGRLVNGGIVIFKLNGVTLKNAEGANLNATVVNGIATVEYTIPVDYSAKDYILTAVYSAKNFDRVETNSSITLTKSNVTAILEPIYMTQGENATVSLVLYDQNGNQLERSTKVAVKVNSKTFINTNTTNGVLNVTLDTADFKNSLYNVTVVLGENSAYNELRLNTILVVSPSVQTTSIQTISMETTNIETTDFITDVSGLDVAVSDNSTIVKTEQ